MHPSKIKLRSEQFADQLLQWFDEHGRKDLPWQKNPTPYRVWVSEIMLQQTRVATVISYYQSFMRRFPNVKSLALAHIDEVLHLWSGLGYYARARNLHKAARIIWEQHGGRFPKEIEQVGALPGIGRSTAAAILAIARGQRHAILDGNVKRVLARMHTVEGWPGLPKVQRELWCLAEQYTPAHRVADYTQAIMDLGATLCTRANPRCELCPQQQMCNAYAQQRVDKFPHPKPRKALPVRSTHMLMLCNEQNEVLIERRPPSGIWGGLWSLPETGTEDPLQWCRDHMHYKVSEMERWDVVRHTFSHFHLDITPVILRVQVCDSKVMEPGQHVWYNWTQPDRRGMAAPVSRLLRQLSEGENV